jgi:2-haloacid dehalogenase
MTQRYQWLIFDADDTLFDYAQAEQNALESTFHEFQLPYDTRTLELYRVINQQLWLRFEKREVTGAQIRTERFAQLLDALQLHEPQGLAERYVDHLAEQTALMRGARETLDALHQTHRIAIATNGMTRVQRPRLARSPLAPFVSELIISEEGGAAKPAREFFDYAFARMGQPRKQDVLLIGDSLTSDMQGGAAYGIDTCWYNPKRQPRPAQPKVTHEIHDLRELIDLVGSKTIEVLTENAKAAHSG